eukprot:2362563-Alexandrium_andersonii.AAC.1
MRLPVGWGAPRSGTPGWPAGALQQLLRRLLAVVGGPVLLVRTLNFGSLSRSSEAHSEIASTSIASCA